MTITKNTTVTDLTTNKKIKLKKGKKVILANFLNARNGNTGYKSKTFYIRIDDDTVAKISGSYLKFKSYYIEDKYSNSIYEEYVNHNGFTSKTNYLIWVNQGTQRLILFKKSSSGWKVELNMRTSTGATESLGNTMIKFNLEVQDFESIGDYRGRMIRPRYETNKQRFGNKIHIGDMPSNSSGGNSSVAKPSSHGCPHISVKNRDLLYNKYNGESQNKLKNSKVIYY